MEMHAFHIRNARAMREQGRSTLLTAAGNLQYIHCKSSIWRFLRFSAEICKIAVTSKSRVTFETFETLW